MKFTHYGGMPYFGKDHLVYAMAAIFFLITFVILPPLLLIVHPLALQLLSLCKLSEHRVTQKFLNIVHIHRLIPLFDSFQSCYKDKLRFFAGLYFTYKISLLMCQSFAISLLGFFAVAEVIILLILGLHSIAQPYKMKVHNVIDSCLFLNLGIIIGLKAYNSFMSTSPFSYLWQITVAVCTLEMVLIYLPLFVVLIWCVHLIVKRRKRKGYQSLESFHNLEDRESVDENEPKTLSRKPRTKITTTSKKQ